VSPAADAEGPISAPGRPEGAQGELMLRTFAFPADANPQGDIFGGWLLGQMDIAGASLARRRAHGRVTTVAVAQMAFKLPVFVGDELSCYCRIARTGPAPTGARARCLPPEPRRGGRHPDNRQVADIRGIRAQPLA